MSTVVNDTTSTTSVDTTTTAATTPAPTATTTATQAQDWFAGFSDADRAFVKNKSWADPSQMLMSYKTLESHLGAPESLVKLPTRPYDTPEGKEAWGKVYDRLGRPEKPEGYEMNVPEGQDKTFATEYSKLFHELGLSKSQAKGIVEKWNAQVESIKAAEATRIKQENEAADKALKEKWGAAFEQNKAIAAKAPEVFKEILTEDTLKALESTLGVAKTWELFHTVMSKTMPNKTFQTGDNPGFNRVLTPGEAMAERTRLMKDTEFSRRYFSGDVDAIDKLNRLNEQIVASSQI